MSTKIEHLSIGVICLSVIIIAWHFLTGFSTASFETFEGPAILVLWPLILLILPGLYFLPTIVAGTRGHRQFSAIFILNLLLGWSGLGWIGAMVWAATN
jgi:hypothetical protein